MGTTQKFFIDPNSGIVEQVSESAQVLDEEDVSSILEEHTHQQANINDLERRLQKAERESRVGWDVLTRVWERLAVNEEIDTDETTALYFMIMNAYTEITD